MRLRYGPPMTSLPVGGTIRPLVRWGDPVMHQPCRPVETFDEELAILVADMVATMYAADGVGLAANQIGVDLAVFVFDCPGAGGETGAGVVCNPVLEVPTGKDRNLVEEDEGCLSLPGAFVACARSDQAEVTGVDQHGEPVHHAGTGLLSRCLQHESDHLVGTVFADKLSTKVRRRLYQEAARVADEFPAGWPVGEHHSHE